MRPIHVFASLSCVVAVIAAPAFAQGWKVGDKVQYYDSGWWDAAVIEIGSGEHAGYFLVKADKYTTQQWAQAKNVRARPAPPAAAKATATAGPRLGDYSVRSYGNPSNPIRLGKITLAAGGTYRFYDNGDNLLGQGRYSYAADKITWVSGILQTQGWGGEFEISREGKTHTIRLKSGTIGSNSTD